MTDDELIEALDRRDREWADALAHWTNELFGEPLRLCNEPGGTVGNAFRLVEQACQQWDLLTDLLDGKPVAPAPGSVVARVAAYMAVVNAFINAYEDLAPDVQGRGRVADLAYEARRAARGMPKADLASIYAEAPEKTALAFEYEIVTAALDPTNLQLLWSDAEADLKAYALRIRLAVEKPMREWDTQDIAERQAEMARHWPDDLPAGFVDDDHDGMA